MPVADSTSISGQWRSSTGRSRRSSGQANGNATRNAPPQRQNANVTGGTMPDIPRPSTILPAHSRLASTRTGQAAFHSRPECNRITSGVGRRMRQRRRRHAGGRSDEQSRARRNRTRDIRRLLPFAQRGHELLAFADRHPRIACSVQYSSGAATRSMRWSGRRRRRRRDTVEQCGIAFGVTVFGSAVATPPGTGARQQRIEVSKCHSNRLRLSTARDFR